MTYSLRGKRIYVAGHNGMVGSALVRRLREGAEGTVLTADRSKDLRDTITARGVLASLRPDVVFLAAAKVGGIEANRRQPVDFLRDNLLIAANVISEAHAVGVERLVFLGSSCIYPRAAPQPITENQLLAGPLEPTNEPYAVAKIAGVKLCDAYRAQYGVSFNSVMPCNLYGPGDNFHPVNSHVPAALIRRFHEAKVERARKVTVWGSGTPIREFLHVDDLADACVFVAEHCGEPSLINVGPGVGISIRMFAELVAEVVGFDGQLEFDRGKPDGTPAKVLDVSCLAGHGWRPRIWLREGLADAYRWFLAAQQDLAKC